MDKVYELEQELQRTRAENEKLKEEIRQKKITIMMNNDHYLTVDENNRKYSQCLKEIKDFLELPEFYLYGKEIIHDRIHNKISEVME